MSAAGAKTAATAKKLLLESIIKKADYYCSRDIVTDVDLYYLVKDFFREFLDLKYEFSFEELLGEIDRTYMETKYREKAVEFIRQIEAIEYSNASFRDEEIKALMKDFALLARLLMKLAEPPRENFWGKFGSIFRRKKGTGAEKAWKARASGTAAPGRGPNGELKAAPEMKRPEDEWPGQAGESQPAGLQEASPGGDTGEGDERRLEGLDSLTEDSNLLAGASKAFDEADEALAAMKEEYEEKPGRAKRAMKAGEDWASAPTEAQQPSAKKAAAGKEPQAYMGEEKKQYYRAEPDVLTKYYGSKTPEKEYASGKKPALKEKPKPAEKAQQRAPGKEQKEQRTQKEQKAPPKASGKADINTLIENAKKLRSKQELTEAYKKIHALYESGSAELQSKYYNDIMALYKRIAGMK
jgi:hypothetical protein